MLLKVRAELAALRVDWGRARGNLGLRHKTLDGCGSAPVRRTPGSEPVLAWPAWSGCPGTWSGTEKIPRGARTGGVRLSGADLRAPLYRVPAAGRHPRRVRGSPVNGSAGKPRGRGTAGRGAARDGGGVPGPVPGVGEAGRSLQCDVAGDPAAPVRSRTVPNSVQVTCRPARMRETTFMLGFCGPRSTSPR